MHSGERFAMGNRPLFIPRDPATLPTMHCTRELLDRLTDFIERNTIGIIHFYIGEYSVQSQCGGMGHDYAYSLSQ